MRRRSFLSLIGAAAVAPALPALPGPASAAAGYNRYQYGLAVFHARTRASVTAADLVGRLRIGSQTAQAIISEMTARGVVAPAASSAAGAVKALDSIPKAQGPSVKALARRALAALDTDDETDQPPAGPSPETIEPDAPEPSGPDIL